MTIHKVFLQSIFTTLLFRCDACSKFLAVSNVSHKECQTKVREHWARAHNVSPSLHPGHVSRIHVRP